MLNFLFLININCSSITVNRLGSFWNECYPRFIFEDFDQINSGNFKVKQIQSFDTESQFDLHKLKDLHLIDKISISNKFNILDFILINRWFELNIQ